MTEHENQKPDPTSTTADVVESVRALIEMMTSAGIGELSLKTDDFKIRLQTESVALAAATPVVSMPPAYAMPAMQGVVTSTLAEVEVSETSALEPKIDGHLVTSPMIGTFYSASAPGEPAYVQVGDEVEMGQVIGIIEAMKIMNEITADKSGVIVEVLVDNAQPVEYGSPLIRISSSAHLD